MKQIVLENIKALDFKTNEAYKTLRTNIRFSGSAIKTIAFTSSVPNEGKSVVSFRLAKALAEDGKSVLYLDADIRKSVLMTRYDANSETVG